MTSPRLALRRVQRALVASALLALISGCASTTPPADGGVHPDAGVDGGLDAGARVVVDEARAVTRSLDQLGGSFDVALGDGTSVHVEVPADALAAPTDVTVTPVLRVGDLPPGTSLRAAVQLAPEGLLLRRPLTLTWPAAEAGAFAIQWSGDFATPHRTPSAAVGAGAALTVLHFSGAGFATGDDAFAQPAAGTSAAFNSAYAQLLADAQAAGVLPWYDAASQARFSALWAAWADGPVASAWDVARSAPAGEAQLDRAGTAARVAASWRSAMAHWEAGYFENRNAAPPTWSGPLGEQSWSGEWGELGLTTATSRAADETVQRVNALLADGIQEAACRAVGRDPCQERPFVERAMKWVELSQLLGGLGRRNGPDVQALDFDAYCERAPSRYVLELAIVAATGEGEELRMLEGGGAALSAAGVSLTGETLQGPITWESSAPEVVSVQHGALLAKAVGSATIAAELKGGCLRDTLSVIVVPRELLTEYVLSGEFEVGGQWLNGGPSAPCNYCPEGDFVTTFAAGVVVEVVVTGATGTATAWIVGVGGAGCVDTFTESPYLSVERDAASMVHGHPVHLSLGPLSVNGVLHAPEDAAPGSRQLSGTASFLPFSCASTIEVDVSLHE